MKLFLRFENLISNIEKWGQEFIDDYTENCSGNNTNILNTWNFFQSSVTGYEYGNTTQANKIVLVKEVEEMMKMILLLSTIIL